MKSNKEKDMEYGVEFGLITGAMLGIELYDDETSYYLILDLGFFRCVFYKDKF